jgi:outer membrane protein TolC
MPLDLGVKNARAVRVRAEAEEAYHRRREALGGIVFEVRRAYHDLIEAQARLEALRRGERNGKAWLTSVAQNFAAGLAEARDFADALKPYFELRIRALQAIYDVNLAAAALGRAVGGDVAK